MRLDYAIVLVSDMERSVAFYRDVLEIPVRFASSHWSELGPEGATLALHLCPPGGGPGGEHPGSSRPGFGVADLDAFHQRMLEHGVPCLQPPKAVFGSRLAQYSDPDGLVFSVGERSSD
jgi:lactoylglutathione lyase